MANDPSTVVQGYSFNIRRLKPNSITFEHMSIFICQKTVSLRRQRPESSFHGFINLLLFVIPLLRGVESFYNNIFVS